MEINLYKKYQPNNFDDLVGQVVVKKTLLNSISNQNIAHAYLLTGIRGVGKTSIAKIFARSINCQDKNHPLVDNCQICLDELLTNEPIDIFEIDAASNNGVDEIRKIIDNVKYIPIKLKYKVYIIDEVHMLSKGAFNALLKTLENPPEYVVFILATTEPNKIPLTILSRCQRFDLTRIDDQIMLDHLKNILNKEQIKYEKEALDLIVSRGEGSVRDTLSLMSKVISYNNDLTIESVYKSLNIAKVDVVNQITLDIIKGQSQSLITNYEQIIKSGVDEDSLVNSLIIEFNQQLIINIANPQLTKKMTIIIEKLLAAQNQFKFMKNKVLYLKVILINLTVSSDLKGLNKNENNINHEIDRIKLDNKVEGKAIQDQSQQVINNQELEDPTNNQTNPVLENKNDSEEVQQKNNLRNNQLLASNSEEVESKYQIKESNQEDISADKERIVTQKKEITQAKHVPIDDEKILETLKHATIDHKKQMKHNFSKVFHELNQTNQHGIAKFFELSLIQACSHDQIVVSIDDNILPSYYAVIETIKVEINKILQIETEIHLISTNNWQKKRMEYIQILKDLKEKDIYKEAQTIFGEEMVNKVN